MIVGKQKGIEDYIYNRISFKEEIININNKLWEYTFSWDVNNIAITFEDKKMKFWINEEYSIIDSNNITIIKRSYESLLKYGLDKNIETNWIKYQIDILISKILKEYPNDWKIRLQKIIDELEIRKNNYLSLWENKL